MTLRVWVVLWVCGLGLASCGEGPEPDPAPPMPSGSPVDSRPVYDPDTASARVSGTVRLAGPAPERSPVRMLGDLYCVRNGIGAMSEDVLVSDDGALENVIVYVREGHQDLNYPIPEEPKVLDQVGCVYTPHVLTLMVGQELRILNSDDTFHNVHAESSGATLFNFAQPVIGAENVETFSQPGLPVRIGCDAHRWMRTYLGVFDHPFHTVSDAAGSFALSLPPGDYEIVAWHERYGEVVSRVELSEGADVDLDLVFSDESP